MGFHSKWKKIAPKITFKLDSRISSWEHKWQDPKASKLQQLMSSKCRLWHELGILWPNWQFLLQRKTPSTMIPPNPLSPLLSEPGCMGGNCQSHCCFSGKSCTKLGMWRKSPQPKGCQSVSPKAATRTCDWHRAPAHSSGRQVSTVDELQSV